MKKTLMSIGLIGFGIFLLYWSINNIASGELELWVLVGAFLFGCIGFYLGISVYRKGLPSPSTKNVRLKNFYFLSLCVLVFLAFFMLGLHRL